MIASFTKVSGEPGPGQSEALGSARFASGAELWESHNDSLRGPDETAFLGGAKKTGTMVYTEADVEFGKALTQVLAEQPGQLSLTEAAAAVRGQR